jgi:plasmid maintenance system antidote protein VapI
MEQIKKENIIAALQRYVERYGSVRKAARSIDIPESLIRSIIKGEERVADATLHEVAAAVGYKVEKWEAVATTTYTRLTTIYTDAQENALVMAVCGRAGTGKTFTTKHYAQSHPDTIVVFCSEFWGKKQFLQELLKAMGADYQGCNISDMMDKAVRLIKRKESPLIVLDEADKLTDAVLYFFITLYNQLEDECGLILLATDYLEKRMTHGLRLKKKGYQEIWSRLGRKCVALRGLTQADIAMVCEVNGVDNAREIDSIIDDAEEDLRRVKRRVHAYLRKKEKATANKKDHEQEA